LNILILGPQGAGKGTQAKRISDAYGIPHIATGDILRTAMAAGTELGRKVKPIYDRGALVPDDLMIAIIRERLSLDAMLREIGRDLSVVFALQLPEEIAVARLMKRAEIEGRVDDTPEAIEKRLELYRRETAPLIEWYRIRSNVVSIHAERTVNEVFEEIEQALEQAAVA
jgi:adenylate kinase